MPAPPKRSAGPPEFTIIAARLNARNPTAKPPPVQATLNKAEKKVDRAPPPAPPSILKTVSAAERHFALDAVAPEVGRAEVAFSDSKVLPNLSDGMFGRATRKPGVSAFV
eukprot:CAMPEP_0181319608 /NCGR_PEP_ID=MMETSP1101-20121128/17668_1 /TAXON_ID=46948 /ORGANISM="Rhodomonas abbreviata, Strain Caron Lab Isolate" /LENGTH=109 /DNA_ID=CAMNT_0023427231 /DNA_START=162 /DNA_END=491 /DNA_ORIENTATION=+